MKGYLDMSHNWLMLDPYVKSILKVESDWSGSFMKGHLDMSHNHYWLLLDLHQWN